MKCGWHGQEENHLGYLGSAFGYKIMCMFQAILGVSEYLYRLRELELMHDGKIPIMVQERANWPKKIGRNELCPCGSGKKYKRCHGR